MPGYLMNYTGPSMNPTLEVGDGLRVLPYHRRTIRPGDVIVFQHPIQKYNIVHRVVRVDPQGIRTRGDNNREDDPWLLQPDQVIGQVAYVDRGAVTRALPAGWSGQMLAAAARTRRFLYFTLVKLLKPVYGALANSGWFRGGMVRGFQWRIAYFHRRAGVEMHLLLGGRPIGRRPAGAARWQIRAPFRLFIDEQALPPPSRFAGAHHPAALQPLSPPGAAPRVPQVPPRHGPTVTEPARHG